MGTESSITAAFHLNIFCPSQVFSEASWFGSPFQSLGQCSFPFSYPLSKGDHPWSPRLSNSLSKTRLPRYLSVPEPRVPRPTYSLFTVLFLALYLIEATSDPLYRAELSLQSFRSLHNFSWQPLPNMNSNVDLKFSELSSDFPCSSAHQFKSFLLAGRQVV